MIHRFWTAALAVVLAGCAEPSAFEKMSLLERDIRLSANRESPGLKISLWLAQADGRELMALDADRPLPGASTLKILILVEAHAQEAQDLRLVLLFSAHVEAPDVKSSRLPL